MIGELIIALILGAAAGGIASLIVPGRTPGGTVGAIVVGIVGGLLGGWVMELLFGMGPQNWIVAFIVAIIGASVILYAMRATRRTI